MSSFHRKYGPTRSSSIGCGMSSLIITKPTTAPVTASCTAHGRGIARFSSSASAKISSIELRYSSWPGARRRPVTAARSAEVTISRSRTSGIGEADATIEPRRRVNVEHPHRLRAVVAKAVLDARRHEHERAGRGGRLLFAERERHLALDDEE